jgi:hypothetical protein
LSTGGNLENSANFLGKTPNGGDRSVYDQATQERWTL